MIVWRNETTLYPTVGLLPAPHSDMPQDVRAIYEEASAIAMNSPRAAAALLRLALEHLLRSMNLTGNLNAMIGSLARKGLAPQIVAALDVVRVSGNDAIHPGQIEDGPSRDEIAKELPVLADFLNYFVNDYITRPNEIDRLYGTLTPGQREAAEKRNAVTSPQS